MRDDPALRSTPAPHQLDALVISSASPGVRDVLMAGRWAVHAHRHAAADAIAQRFTQAMQAIWAAD